MIKTYHEDTGAQLYENWFLSFEKYYNRQTQKAPNRSDIWFSKAGFLFIGPYQNSGLWEKISKSTRFHNLG